MGIDCTSRKVCPFGKLRAGSYGHTTNTPSPRRRSVRLRSTGPGVPPRVAGILPARGEGVPPLHPPLPVTTPPNPTAPQRSSHRQKPIANCVRRPRNSPNTVSPPAEPGGYLCYLAGTTTETAASMSTGRIHNAIPLHAIALASSLSPIPCPCFGPVLETAYSVTVLLRPSPSR